MQKNMSNTDRIIRILMAAVVVILYFTNVISGTVAIILLAFSAVLILTGFFSVCPLYLPFGIRTNGAKSA